MFIFDAHETQPMAHQKNVAREQYNNNNNLYLPQLAVAIDNTKRKTEIHRYTQYTEKKTQIKDKYQELSSLHTTSAQLKVLRKFTLNL